MTAPHAKYCTRCFLKADNTEILDSTKEVLRRHRVIRTVNSNGCILSQGSIPAHVYCLSEGQVNAFETDVQGHTDLIFSFKNEGFFPLLALYTKKLTKYEFTAVDRAVLCQFPIQIVQELLTVDPGLTKIFFNSACNLGLDAYRRIAVLQAKTATEKVLMTLEQFADANNICHMSRKEIAAWTNMANETVIRTLSALEKKKRIKKLAEGIKLCPASPSKAESLTPVSL